jgi:serine/threonine protein kinase
MQFAASETFHDHLHPKIGSSLSNTQRTIVALGFAHAMSKLHFHRIAHRCLTPRNILPDECCLPTLLGFDLSAPAESKLRFIEGRARAAQRCATLATDVDAFGMLFWEVAAGISSAQFAKFPAAPDFSTSLCAGRSDLPIRS